MISSGCKLEVGTFERHSIAATAIALTGCSQDSSRDYMKIVGSSTVYPFSTAVAEAMVNTNPALKTPVIESTGTGGGMKLFCGGVGVQHPDVEVIHGGDADDDADDDNYADDPFEEDVDELAGHE